jgi:hypothetical protein
MLMSQPEATYASPKRTKELVKAFGEAAPPVKVTMRASKDVSKFIHKVAVARRKATTSKLQFA